MVEEETAKKGIVLAGIRIVVLIALLKAQVEGRFDMAHKDLGRRLERCYIFAVVLLNQQAASDSRQYAKEVARKGSTVA